MSWLLNLKEKEIKSVIPEIDKIEAPLKPGGQKVVFPCFIKNNKYALKFLKDSVQNFELTTEESLEFYNDNLLRAQREINLMAKCKSQYIVRLGPLKLKEVIIKGKKTAYFTEEWVCGNDLFTLIENKHMFSQMALNNLCVQITEAIFDIYSLDNIHRDITPRNIIMLENSSEYKLLDLGIAYAFDEDSITRQGIIGTIHYMAPERFNSAIKRDLDFRSDMFSLGVVLYHCSTGKHPFFSKGMPEKDVVKCICSITPPPPSKYRADLGSTFDKIIFKLIAKNAHLRYRTQEELHSDLESWVNKRRRG